MALVSDLRMSRRFVPVLAGLFAMAAVLTLRVVEPAPFERLRLSLFDSLQRQAPWAGTDSPVRIIDIDEESLARHGQWPWSRDKIAELVGILQDLQVRAIGLDIIFAEPDRTSPRRLLAEWRTIYPSMVTAATPDESLPDHDETLAKVIARGKVVTGMALLPAANGASPPRSSSIAVIGENPVPLLQGYGGVVRNLPVLDDAAEGQGSLTIAAGRDEIIRRLPLISAFGREVIPSLALETLRVAGDDDTIRIRSEAGAFGQTVGLAIRTAERTFPMDRDGSFWLHHGPLQPHQTVPAWQVLDRDARQALAARLGGRIVLVGTGATGLNDLRPTPLNPFEPGVNLHARAIEQMLAGRFVARPAVLAGVEMAAAALAGILISLLVAWLGLRLSVAITMATMAGTAMAPLPLFTSHGLLVDPSLLVIVVAVTFVAAMIARYLVSERDGLRLRAAFNHYLSPDLVAALARDPNRLRLGGESREMTFVFTDLEGFTALMETLPPEKIVSLLNAYIDGLSQIAMDHGGTIDKIVGDALHVMFNAPLDQPDHAERAVRCATAMDAFATGFAAERQAEGLAFGVTRIGVNTGRTVVGNFGGSRRFDYTAHGDAINTAARLETANKSLGTRICIARATVDQTSGIAFNPVGTLMLKGKAQGIEAFTPCIDDGGQPTWDAAYRDAFARMLSGDASGAQAMLSLHEAYPANPIIALHARRIRAGETSVQMAA
jgi:adenylate cyclase